MKNWREEEPKRATNKRGEKDYEATTTKLAQKREGENKKTAAGGSIQTRRHPFLQANARKKSEEDAPFVILCSLALSVWENGS